MAQQPSNLISLWYQTASCVALVPGSVPPFLPALVAKQRRMCVERYIGTSGTDAANTGCNAATPLLTFARCVELSTAGSSCLFLPGTHSVAGASGVQVSLTSFTVAQAPQSSWPTGTAETETIIDGTVALSGWTQMSDAYGDYYKSTSAYTGANLPWQLFVNEQPLTPARWPNALSWTPEWWDRDTTWARQTTSSTCGSMVDAAYSPSTSLAEAGVSFDGCNAIINNEHWITRRYLVRDHVAGTNRFSYQHASNSLCQKYAGDATTNRYFIDGCVAAFDAPGEWVVDANGFLLIRLPVALSSVAIGSLAIRGKVQSYAMAFLQSDDLIVRDLSFFGTAPLVYDSQRLTLDNCKLNYPSASRRSLGGSAAEFDGATMYGIPVGVANHGLIPDTGEYEITVPTLWIGRLPSSATYTSANVTNNEIRFSEGPGIVCAACGFDTFTNNLVDQAAHPFGRSIQFHGTDVRGVTLRRNSLAYSGSGGIAWLWGPDNLAELNHISHTGMLIVDNEGIQGGKLTSQTTFRFNWVRDASGLGLRFDAGENGQFGTYNNLQFNVVFRNLQGGLAAKADYASNYRNTGTDNQQGADVEGGGSVAADMKICQCYPSSCNAEGGGTAFTNRDSVSRGNVGTLDPGTQGGLLNPYDLPGTHDYNLNLKLVSYGLTPERERHVLYRSYETNDFRPALGSPLIDAGAENTLAGPSSVVDQSQASPVEGGPPTVGSAPDIGAYEYGHDIYWIPGKQYAHAAVPVPPHGSVGVLPSADLMFLQGAAAASHAVYLAAAGNELVKVGELQDTRNILTPPAPFSPGTSYLWRVDAITSDGNMTQGTVWNFTAGCADVDCAGCGTSTLPASCVACAPGRTLISGFCSYGGSCTNGTWTVIATGSATTLGKVSKCDRDTTPNVCGPFSASGLLGDTFAMVEQASSSCAASSNGAGLWWIVQTSGATTTLLENLGCAKRNSDGSFLNEFTLSTNYLCHDCEYGYVVVDPTVGCVPSRSAYEPRAPPSPPAPPNPLSPPSPPPSPPKPPPRPRRSGEDLSSAVAAGLSAGGAGLVFLCVAFLAWKRSRGADAGGRLTKDVGQTEV